MLSILSPSPFTISRKEKRPLECANDSVLSLTPGKSILSPEALHKFQMAFLTGRKIGMAGDSEELASKRRKLDQDSMNVLKDAKDERSQDIKDTKADVKEASVAKEAAQKEEASEKEVSDAAREIALQLVEWSSGIELVDDLLEGEVTEEFDMSEDEHREQEIKACDVKEPALPATDTKNLAVDSKNLASPALPALSDLKGAADIPDIDIEVEVDAAGFVGGQPLMEAEFEIDGSAFDFFDPPICTDNSQSAQPPFGLPQYSLDPAANPFAFVAAF